MNEIIVYFKSLLQLSKLLVVTFAMFLFIGGCWLFHDLQYRYVVDSRYNTIFDKVYSVYLINKGISMDIINDKIYAMDDDVYVIINQEKMILQPIESLGPSETLDMYKKLSEAHGRFKSQGSRISF